MRKRKYSITQAKKDLPRRLKHDNKTRGGKCLVIAGAEGQWGAAVLCAKAAARMGAGYTYIYDFKKSFPTLKFPDFLINSKQKDFSKFNSIAIGPGVKDQAFLNKCILQLKKIGHPSVVLDAEAINTLAKQKKKFKLPSSWIMTPHEGEAAGLLEISSDDVRADRESTVQKIQKQWDCIVVLKGADTLVANEKNLFQIQSGNSALAKAGTGDVLTGIITGLLSQNLPASKAACLGVFIHGFIADLWIQNKNDQLSLIASDLIDHLPKTLSQIRTMNSAK